MSTEESDNEKIIEESDKLKVAELTPRLSNIHITFKVVNKSEAREIVSRRDNERHLLSDAQVGDETGTVIISLWNDAIDKFEVGKVYSLTNCYTGLYRGSLRLKIGNESEITTITDDIEKVNTDNDLSSIDHGSRRRSYSRGYGNYTGYRRQGGYHRDRSYGRRDRRSRRRY